MRQSNSLGPPIKSGIFQIGAAGDPFEISDLKAMEILQGIGFLIPTAVAPEGPRQNSIPFASNNVHNDLRVWARAAMEPASIRRTVETETLESNAGLSFVCSTKPPLSNYLRMSSQRI